MNELLWRFWIKLPDQESFLNRLTKTVVLLWILAVIAGFFCAYRFGEYMQTKRMVDENWHPVILQPIETK